VIFIRNKDGKITGYRNPEKEDMFFRKLD